MGATAAATLAALAGREPRARRLAGRARPRGPTKATADAVIVLWMAGGMAQTETFDPKRYTPFAPGVHDQGRAEHVPGDRHRRRPHQVHAGPRADRQGHRSRHGDPHVQRRRPRLHPALAAPVPLAHRLHPAAADGDAAHRRGDLADARAEEPGHAGVHRHRPDGRGRRRDRHAQGVPHRRLPRRRARAVPDRRSAGRGVGGAAAEGARPTRGSAAGASCFEKLLGAGAGAPVRQRLPARVAGAVAGRRRSAARRRRRRRRSTCRSSRRQVVRRLQHRPLRAGLPAGAPAGRRRRPLRRGDVRVHPVRLLGHARERPRARRGR